MIGRNLGRYVIQQEIGAGGMGVVYRARDTRLERDVAVKVVSPDLLASPEVRGRFRREALALSRLTHPNIAAVYDFDQCDGVELLVMELVPGETLQDRLQRGPLPPRDAAALAAQLAHGLAAAHAAGVIHRDIKPGNLRLTPEGQLKILDFGLARSVTALASAPTVSVTAPASTMGTLAYMAPEQVRGEPLDARADIHAVGAVLFEMVTGQRAFPEDQVPRLIDAVLHEAPPSPRALNRAVTADLERITLKALEKDPSRRYQSAAELAVDLERLVAPEAVRERPIARPPLRQYLASVNPRWFVTSAGAALLVLLLIWQFSGTEPVLSFAERDWILVADCDNRTGNPLFDGALDVAVTVGLEQSAYANVFPRSRMSTVLQRMKKPPATRIDEATGLEICQRENLRALLTYSIGAVGGQYVIVARLVDPLTGLTVRSYTQQATGDQVLTALNRIVNDVRSDLGESLASVRRDSRPLPLVTTSSLEALKLFADATQMWSKGQYGEAVTQCQAAIEKDAEFAMAHAALGRWFYSHIFNDPVRGRSHMEKALGLTDRVTDRERMHIEASHAHNLGYVPEATTRYRAYLSRYPDDLQMRYNFANLLRQNDRFEEAIREYQEVIRIDPNNANAAINLATTYSVMSRYPEALAHYARGFELQPDWITSGTLNHEYGFALVRAGSEAKAREVFAIALAKPDAKARGLRSLALLEMLRGRYALAARHLDDAIVDHTAANRTLSAARDHLFAALVADGRGDRASRIAHLNRSDRLLEGLPGQTTFLARVGVAWCRAGLRDRCAAILAKLQPQIDPNSATQSGELHWLEGELALARADTRQALDRLTLAAKEQADPFTSYSLARAYASAAMPERAIAEYERFVENANRAAGWEPQHDWLKAHLELASLHAGNGNVAKARARSDALLALLADGDANLPLRTSTLKFAARLGL